MGRTHWKTNLIVVDGDVAFIHLTQGYIATIDAADVELVRQYGWRASVDRRLDGTIRAVYVVASICVPKRGTRRLHRVITGVDSGTHVDHRDADGLNNRRYNLRTCSHTENSQSQRIRPDNTSGYKGVFWRKDTCRWRAVIYAGTKRINIGDFGSAEEAARAYDVASVQHHGDFALPNNILKNTFTFPSCS